jgi:hypothetical protein
MKKLVYMVIGGFLALALTFGAYATFAQTDDDTAVPEMQSDAGDTDTFRLPGLDRLRSRGFDRSAMAGIDGRELLAEALGISVDELETAQAAARAAAIEQAVAEGLITQAQADQLLSGDYAGRRGFGLNWGIPGGAIDYAALLADALGISVEDLQAAQAEAHAAKLAEMVEAGVLTQEQADMLQAYKDVAGYVDYDALTASVRSFFQAAIEQALADGAITQAQADQMLENLSRIEMRGFPGLGGRGGHRDHGRGGFGGPVFFVPSQPSAPATTGTSGA